MSNQIEWNAVEDATGYNLYRSEAEGGPFTKLNAVPIVVTIYTDITAVDLTPYYYRVSSIDTLDRESIPSSSIFIPGLYPEKVQEMIDDLRVMLQDREVKDNIYCPQFSDDDLYVFLKKALHDINAHPYLTSYSFENFPEDWEYLICLGAQTMAYIGLGVVEKGRQFEITDNGIAFVPPQLGEYLQTHASNLMATYTELKERIKLHYRPGPRAVGTFRVQAISPAYIRLRHLRQRQII